MTSSIFINCSFFSNSGPSRKCLVTISYVILFTITALQHNNLHCYVQSKNCITDLYICQNQLQFMFKTVSAVSGWSSVGMMLIFWWIITLYLCLHKICLFGSRTFPEIMVIYCQSSTEEQTKSNQNQNTSIFAKDRFWKMLCVKCGTFCSGLNA